MEQRLNLAQVAPAALAALRGVEEYLAKSGIEHSLLELVKMRASQLNGCAFCLDMHSKDARAGGESEQRLYLLDAWRETTLYSARERAALAWTEALTLVSETHAPDDTYRELAAQFSEPEIADLTVAIATINSWNRLSIGFRTPAGSYKPRTVQRRATG